MAAPPKNENALKRGEWLRTLTRAIAQDDGKRLRTAAERLLDCAAEGQDWAIKELGDRLDGKPGQAVTVAGDQENPLVNEILVKLVHASRDSSPT